MNAKIRELADQILPNEKEFHQGDPKEWGYFFSGSELEHFAELIVRECLGRIELSHRMDSSTESWVYNSLLEDIKEHFAVEVK